MGFVYRKVVFFYVGLPNSLLQLLNLAFVGLLLTVIDNVFQFEHHGRLTHVLAWQLHQIGKALESWLSGWRKHRSLLDISQ